MDNDHTIRRYRPSDAEQVWTVHELALRASPLEFVEDAPADEDIAAISDHYLDPGGEFLVGNADGMIVAIGGFLITEDSKAEIRRMRVHPDYQRQGYGARILEKLEERARKREVTQIVLETNEHLKAAQNLYEKHAYEETHRREHPVAGDDFIHYQKLI